MTGNFGLRRALVCAAVLLPLAVAPALAQAPTSKPANCNAWKLDEAKNRIVFNDPKIVLMMPDKEERAHLREQGQPGQLFLMKNCNSPDFEGLIPIFAEAEASGKSAEEAPSAVRVVILAEKGKWVQVKGTTGLWKGTGWVKMVDDLVIVKY